MQQNIMEKELKSYTGVLLRTDLTRHSQFSQSADFCQEGWDGLASQVSPQKDARAGFQFFFHTVLLHFQHHISKNWRPILPCYISGQCDLEISSLEIPLRQQKDFDPIVLTADEITAAKTDNNEPTSSSDDFQVEQ